MKKSRYARIPKFEGGGNTGGGNASAWAAAGGASGNLLGNQIEQNYAYRDDGSVREKDYVAAQHWKYGAQGAQMGSSFGPWGSLVGGIAGHLYGVGKGIGDAKKINRNVREQKEQEERDSLTLEQEQKAANDQAQDDYSRSYMASNNIYGNQGVGLYPGGGTMGDPAKKMSPQEWDAYNTQRKWVADPRATPNARGYKTYYDSSAVKILPSQNHESGWEVQGLKEGAVDQYGLPSTNYHQEYEAPVVKTPIMQYAAPRKAAVVMDPMKASGYNGVITDPSMVSGYTKAYGGKTLYAPGGKLIPTSSDTFDAQGASHSQGGITLKKNDGQAFAEIEGGETIQDNNVYSDRLTYKASETYADAASKISKKKGKYEENLKSTSDITKNTAKRMISNLDMELSQLFEHQENFKVANGIDNEMKQFAGGGGMDADVTYLKDMESDDIELAPREDGSASNSRGQGVNWGNLANAAGSLVSYADNIYNAGAINRTPKVPKPTQKKAQFAIPVAMNTTYNIEPALSESKGAYRQFVQNVDANTSNSADARANKLAGFSAMLKANNSLQAQKLNVENQLKNQDSMNRQGVMNANTQNAQNVGNTNLAQIDQYNMHNMERADEMNKAKSQNFANAVDDTQKIIQDTNMRKTDQERVMLDTLKYNDGAGLSKMIGTPTMTSMINSNPEYYSKVEQTLKNSGQTQALKEFYKRHPKK